MRLRSVFFIAVVVFASCGGGEGDDFPSDPPAKLTAPKSAAPAPPPPPTDPEGKGPAPVPPQIAAFLSEPVDIEIVLSREADGRHAESQLLPPDVAKQTIAVLTSPDSYTENHPLCTDQGIRLQLERGSERHELSIGLMCRHVIDVESGEELGCLSNAGQTFFVNLARRVHVDSP